MLLRFVGGWTRCIVPLPRGCSFRCGCCWLEVMLFDMCIRCQYFNATTATDYSGAMATIIERRPFSIPLD